ncbi:hypothetical protein QCA50_010777 [Cerrena zonata]|uniref:Uncharacterized protein n=1 Tax=Cerrena zonata TaxID=2478898 RepID=A0AAW0G372_9APHY
MGLYHDPGWHELVATEFLLCYNAAFRAFTPDPPAFRKMMLDTGAVISGSTALYFLLRQPLGWKPDDVDIIAAGAAYEILLAFILTLPGAVVLSDTFDDKREEGQGPYDDAYPYAGLKRLVRVSTAMARFDVIHSSGSVPSNAITHYWGSHVMNAITADSVLCAYPTLTLAYKAMQIRAAVGGDPVTKYRKRGFEVFARGHSTANLAHTHYDSVTCASRDRYFGDDATLIVPIRQPSHSAERTVHKREQNGSTYQVSAWRLGGPACGTAECYLASFSHFEEITVISGKAQRRPLRESFIV